jgi:hypothetical protein
MNKRLNAKCYMYICTYVHTYVRTYVHVIKISLCPGSEHDADPNPDLKLVGGKVRGEKGRCVIDPDSVYST